MSQEIVDVERMSTRDARNWRARNKRRIAAAGRPKKSRKRLTREEAAARQRARDRVRRKRWVERHPERMSAARAAWFAKNPGYKTEWMRDKRAEAPPKPPRVKKTPEERKATKREYDRCRYAANRERILAERRAKRRSSVKVIHIPC